MTAPEAQELALTPTQIEGPYYKVCSPHRASLIESGITGTPLRGAPRVNDFVIHQVTDKESVTPERLAARVS